jgi:predicted glycoside hydrolase/deacetylase ChbG (UPF0249 family)
MRIIINADDFGFSQETVQATIECFEGGGLTSATIMPNMPATQAAVAYARQNPRFSFGVHLTFTSDGLEHPVLDPKEIPDIVGENGQFLGPFPARAGALRNKLPVDQISREMHAQIAVLHDAGVPLSHVDSHGHLHKFKPFRLAMREVLPSFGITRVRTVQDVYFQLPWKSPTYWLGGLWQRGIKRHFTTTDHLYLPTLSNDMHWPEKLLKRIEGSDAAETLEIGVHPGSDEPWRVLERDTCGPFAEGARQAGHTLMTWHDMG